MGFIKSVIDHVNKGGDAQDIERGYKELKEAGAFEEGGGDDDEGEVEEVSPTGVFKYAESDAEDVMSSDDDFEKPAKVAKKAEHGIPKKGTVVRLRFPTTSQPRLSGSAAGDADVWGCKVVSKVERREGVRAVKVQSLQDDNASWEEWVPVADWQNRLVASGEKGLAGPRGDRGGPLVPTKGGRSPKMLPRPQEWASRSGSGGGSGGSGGSGGTENRGWAGNRGAGGVGGVTTTTTTTTTSAAQPPNPYNPYARPPPAPAPAAAQPNPYLGGAGGGGAAPSNPYAKPNPVGPPKPNPVGPPKSKVLTAEQQRIIAEKKARAKELFAAKQRSQQMRG